MTFVYRLGFLFGQMHYAFRCGMYDGENKLFAPGVNQANAVALNKWRAA